MHAAAALVLATLYFILPAAAVLRYIAPAVRQKRIGLLRPVIPTLVSAAAIGFAINFAYARAAGAAMLPSQVLLTAYVAAGVLLALKLFDLGLRRAAARVVERLPERVTPRARSGVATALRVLLLFTVGLPYVMAVAMVYRPRVHGPDPMQQLGRAFEDVTFHDARGRRLAGWWIDADARSSGGGGTTGADTVLLCHGLGASKSNALPMAEHLLRAGYNVFAIDFSAHGGSAGQVTTFGDDERHDVLAAVNWLTRERPGRVFGVGASMGAAALVAAACDESEQGRAIRAVAVYGTYDDLGALTRTVCDRQFPPPLNRLGRHVAVPLAGLHAGRRLGGFVPADRLGRFPPRPILVIHGRSDEIIAFEHGRRLFDRAAEPKRALWLDGDHNSVLNDADAARAVREFFASVK